MTPSRVACVVAISVAHLGSSFGIARHRLLTAARRFESCAARLHCPPMTLLRRGEPGYDPLTSGFNVALDHDPDVVVDAAGPDDVVAAVELAARDGLPVAVMNTGHGPSVPIDRGVLIRTGRMSGVAVDPVERTARVGGGASWHEVIEATAPHGLAPLNGSSPHVGAVGYTLGGGVGLLARRFGFAADHVRSLDVVTADGRLRHVTPESDADLFWALRGAGANLGVVTAMEIDLFPVTTLLGGELCFAAEACEELLQTYAGWAAAVPETMASSVLLLRYPDVPALPPELKRPPHLPCPRRLHRRRPCRRRGVGAAAAADRPMCPRHRAPDAVLGDRQHPPRTGRRTRSGVRPEHPAARLRRSCRSDPGRARRARCRRALPRRAARVGRGAVPAAGDAQRRGREGRALLARRHQRCAGRASLAPRRPARGDASLGHRPGRPQLRRRGGRVRRPRPSGLRRRRLRPPPPHQDRATTRATCSASTSTSRHTPRRLAEIALRVWCSHDDPRQARRVGRYGA